MSDVQDEKSMAMQDQVEKLQAQKNTLIKELDAVEERFEKTNRLYRKYFPVIIDTAFTEETPFSAVCRDLSTALKKGESEAKIEYIFEQLKTAMLKEGIGPAGPVKKRGLLSTLLKGKADSFIDEYKTHYLDVLNTLGSTLDSKYTARMDSIVSRIKSAQDTDDISDIRQSVFDLVFAYISDTSQDREKVNAFVREIVGRILEIESLLAETYQHTDHLFQSNEGFESVLSHQMQGLQQSADVASSLESLKAQVSERLASIERALKKKQAKDTAIREAAQQNTQVFKSGFSKLRLELDKATKHAEELEQKLNLDQLTGAFNRRAYDKRVESEMARFLRYGTGFSLLLVDADKFKIINDTYGHAIGDKCLQEIIKRSIPLLRKNDMLARYGGEEFVVIMPETGIDGAKEVAEKIRQTIEKIEFIYKKEKVRVTVSIGVSQAREGDTHHRQIFERADVAMYKAKEAGRNQVQTN